MEEVLEPHTMQGTFSCGNDRGGVKLCLVDGSSNNSMVRYLTYCVTNLVHSSLWPLHEQLGLVVHGFADISHQFIHSSDHRRSASSSACIETSAMSFILVVGSGSKSSSISFSSCRSRTQ